MGSQNRHWMAYPSQTMDPEANIEDIIAAQSVISRVMHVYIGILVPVGLLAGICIVAAFAKVYHVQKKLGKLEIYLLALAITDITILLFSMTTITRPGYMEITNLSCGFLAFFFNVSYFNSQYLQVMFIFIFLLNKDVPTNPTMQKIAQSPLLCVSLTLVVSLCSSLIVVGLLGTVAHLHEPAYCQVDPLNAAQEYDIVKFCFGFGIPSFINVVLLVLLCVKLAKIKDFTWSEIHNAARMVLPISIIMFSCRLFYNIMLLSRTMLKVRKQNGFPRDELLMNIAEIVMFGQSCCTLVVILCINKHCRAWVHHMYCYLTQRCRRNEAASTNVTNVVGETGETGNVTTSAHSENVPMTAVNVEQ
ncbi:C-X-C chemokine receptor type 2-like [Ambystoma mexicanum]|uniref:C-X-C chemokine receptor type 2-like n=1 Tax=Ambystoma mexicanum TaxID=8296 RepID=UPI0037E7C914